MNKLFESLTLNNGETLPNRIVMSPMTTWASNDDYTVSEAELKYYAARVKGMGMVITGCVNISENGIGFTHQFASYDDKFLPGLTKLASTIKQNGAKAVLQINHAGNKTLAEIVGKENVVAPSAVPTEATMFVDSFTPRALTETEIEQIIREFSETTKRAIEAGFDGIEIHGAHSFLIQNFLSPHFNRRTDKWGGSLENRMRFALEVYREIKRVADKYADDDFIIGWRFSPEEHYEDGLRFKDVKVLIDKLAEKGITYIHASLPNALKPFTHDNHENIITETAKVIDKRAAFLVAGQIDTGKKAEEVLDNGADLVAIAHGLITDLDWIEKVRAGKDDEIIHSISEDRLKELAIPDKLWGTIKNSGDWFEIK